MVMSLGTMRCPLVDTEAHDAQTCPACKIMRISMGGSSCQNAPTSAHDTQSGRFRPPCECQYCQLQYGNHHSTCEVPLTYHGHVDDKTVALLAKADMDLIRGNIEKMRLMVETRGDVLADRWCRNRRVRKEILLKVNERLYPTRNPLLHQMSPTSDLRLEDVYKKVVTWLLPYLNIENLVEDASNLLKLIHYRVNSEPADWVPFDNVQIHEAWRHGLIPERSAEGCIRMYGDEMGRWQPFKSYEVHRAEAYGAPRALLILAAQASLLAFLEMVMREILERADQGSKTDSAASISKKASNSAVLGCRKWMGIINAKQESEKSSFGAVFASQAFAKPPEFDIDILLDIAESQVAEAHDELWLRQTDPEYFMEVANRYNAQAPYTHSGIKKLGIFTKNEKMNDLANFMTLNPVNRWRDWQCILEECQAVKREMNACNQAICLGKPLPSEVERALGCLSAVLNKFRQKGRKELTLRFVTSVPFRDWFRFDGLRGIDQLVWNVKDDKILFQEDPVGWCIYRLTDRPKGEPLFDCSLLFQLLDEFLGSNSRKESERIDHDIYRYLSDSVALEQMWNLLQFHRPWFRVLDDIDFSRESSQSWRIISKLDENKPLLFTMDQIGAAMSRFSKVRMPQGKRNEEWITRRDVAHRALSDLWKAASDYHGTYLNQAKVPQKYVDTLLEQMRLADSPENQTRLAVEKHNIINRLEAARECAEAEKHALRPVYRTSFAVQQHVQDKYRPEPQAKTKTKTRCDGTPTTMEEVTEKIPPSVEEVPPILYRIKTKAKVWKVIHAIFPDPEHSREESGHKVDWTEFLSAMRTLNFTVVNRGGSAFVFSGQIMLPDSLSTQKRSICVHRPHTSTEMSPILLRSLGRRFLRRFGWQRANFLAIDSQSALKPCAGCRVAQYCSRECQKADWPNHKIMCKKLAPKKAGSLPLGSNLEEPLIADAQYRCGHCGQ